MSAITYFESSICFSLISGLDGVKLWTEELEWLGHGRHSLSGPRDLDLELVKGVHSLNLLAIGQPFHKELKLLLQQLVLLILCTRD